MKPWLKSLLGSGEFTELPEELSKLLDQAKRDKRALRDLRKRSETASKKIEDLADPLEANRAAAESLDVQVAQLEMRATVLEDSVSRLELLEQREEKIGKTQERLMETVERNSNAADRLEGRVAKIHTQLGTVSSSEKMLANLLDPKGGLTKVRAEIDELMAKVERLTVRNTDFAKVEARIGAIGERAVDLEEDQKAMTSSVESVSKRLVEADQRVAELGDGMQAIAQANQEIEKISGPDGTLARVRVQVEQAHEESLSYGQEVADVRENQAVVLAAQEGVASSYEDLRSKMEAVNAGVDKANANVARVDKAMVDLTKAEEIGARTERQLNALKTLSDHISGKIASVERQREAMDLTEAQARALTDLHWELEAKLKEARSQISEVKKVHSSVEKLSDMNTKVGERSDELRAEQSQVERDSKTLRAALAGLQEQMRRSTKRFELEQSTLEADGQRAIALRTDVTDLENRFRELEEAGQTVNEASRRVDDMSARTASLSAELGRLSEQVELVEGMREGMSEARRAGARANQGGCDDRRARRHRWAAGADRTGRGASLAGGCVTQRDPGGPRLSDQSEDGGRSCDRDRREAEFRGEGSRGAHQRAP